MEDMLDNATAEEKIKNINGQYGPDDAADLTAQKKKQIGDKYSTRIQIALRNLKEHSATFLSKQGLAELSPKFLTILK